MKRKNYIKSITVAVLIGSFLGFEFVQASDHHCVARYRLEPQVNDLLLCLEESYACEARKERVKRHFARLMRDCKTDLANPSEDIKKDAWLALKDMHDCFGELVEKNVSWYGLLEGLHTLITQNNPDLADVVCTDCTVEAFEQEVDREFMRLSKRIRR